jgi:hypothetical protein
VEKIGGERIESRTGADGQEHYVYLITAATYARRRAIAPPLDGFAD